jgi:ribonucleotide reductase beta subunit family protein with ferritin-like domain
MDSDIVVPTHVERCLSPIPTSKGPYEEEYGFEKPELKEPERSVSTSSTASSGFEPEDGETVVINNLPYVTNAPVEVYPIDEHVDPIDPILDPNYEFKEELKPIRHPDIWDMHIKAQGSFWTVGEIDLSQDVMDWNKLTPAEQHFLTFVLSFFLKADIKVADNLVRNFVEEFQFPEAKHFFTFQAAMENEHSNTYNDLLFTFVTDPAERKKALKAVEQYECVNRKDAWALKYGKKETAPVGERLLAYVILEALFFSSAFCSIFWFKKRNLMPGLCFSNELISRDEGMHADFGVLLLNKYLPISRPSNECIYRLMRQAVDIELDCVKEALPVAMIGMNAVQMSEYVMYCADRLLLSLGLERIYRVENPFDWMDMISVNGKTNFFEKRVGEYSKAALHRQTSAEPIFAKSPDHMTTSSYASMMNEDV